MSTQSSLAAKEAIRRARISLRKGDNASARRWAEKAASLAPKLEDSWLILAAISRPQLSVRYLERALAIDPQSKRALKGMIWAKKRLTSKAETTQPTTTENTETVVEKEAPKDTHGSGGILQAHTSPVKETQPNKATKPLSDTQPNKAIVPPPKRRFLRKSLSAFVLTILILAIIWALIPQVSSFASSVDATSTATFSQEHWGEGDISKPTYTPTTTPTSTPTQTPTSTFTPEPTETPLPPTKTPRPANTAIPAPVDNYVSGGAKYVLVDISEQHLYAYEGNTLVFSFIASTGMNGATATGNFSVLNKVPSAYGSTWDIWMPSWLGIYWAGSLQNGIHALPIMANGATLWAGYLGTPISYGCVVLSTYEAQLLYNWVDIGTPVDIQW